MCPWGRRADRARYRRRSGTRGDGRRRPARRRSREWPPCQEHATQSATLTRRPSVAPLVAKGAVREIFPADGYDPWNFFDEPCPKPIVVAVHGVCNTLGIELALASQASVAAESTRFA